MSALALRAASSAGSGAELRRHVAMYDFCLCSSPCFSAATMSRVTGCSASASTPRPLCTTVRWRQVRPTKHDAQHRVWQTSVAAPP